MNECIRSYRGVNASTVSLNSKVWLSSSRGHSWEMYSTPGKYTKDRYIAHYSDDYTYK